jgi:hypothetical protein
LHSSPIYVMCSLLVRISNYHLLLPISSSVRKCWWWYVAQKTCTCDLDRKLEGKRPCRYTNTIR